MPIVISAPAVMELPKPKKKRRYRVKPKATKSNSSKILEQPNQLMTPTQILDAKAEILRMLSDGLARTITEACNKLGLMPARVYSWAKYDKDFKELLDACYEVVADKIETDFVNGRNDIPKMMVLKGIRPKYRDNFRVEYSTQKVEEFLAELKKLSAKKQE